MLQPRKPKESTKQPKGNKTFRLFRYFRLFRTFPVFFLPMLLAFAQTAPSFTVSKDETKLLLGNRVLLDGGKDGFMSVKQVKPAPDGKHIAVIACGFECNDNVGFLFNAGGAGKRKFTARWDSILQDKLEWSADGNRLYYFRINSSGADPMPNAPAEGWVEVDVATGRKTMETSRRLKPKARYAVFRVSPEDPLNVREAPGLNAQITGKFEGKVQGIQFTGESRKIGRTVWVKIKHEGAVGWVNQNYLYEMTLSTDQHKP
jgi:hypothetical protein